MSNSKLSRMGLSFEYTPPMEGLGELVDIQKRKDRSAARKLPKLFAPRDYPKSPPQKRSSFENTIKQVIFYDNN